MTRDEILEGIAAMQRIQRANPPSSETWQRASKTLHRLVTLLTGKPPADARG